VAGGKSQEAEQVISIGTVTPEVKAGINAVVAFMTDRCDQTKEELAKKGISFFGKIAGCPGVLPMICFKYPDENILQLVEETVEHTDKI